jgi:hypothetical protein
VRKIAAILFFLLLTIEVIAQPDGPFDPSTSGADASVGSFVWNNTVNIFSSDNTRARVDLDNNGDISNYVTATNFVFAIPTGSVIDGIVIEIERSDNGGSGNIKDNSVKIIKGGTILGTDKASGLNWPSSDAYKTYGNATDLWGTTWTDADINSSNFGVSISAKRTGGSGNNQARIDHIRITVYYTVTLPVELLYFTGTNQNNYIKLEWMTASEVNNDYFIINRSTDGVYFSELSRVKGNGNSSLHNSYSCFDYESMDGTGYYRLSQVDFNGHTEDFAIITTNIIKEDVEVIVNIFDISGHLIKTENSMLSQRLKILNSLNLSCGIYIVQSTSVEDNFVTIEKYFLNSSESY